MEWVLQLVDDMDDTVNAVLHSCFGLNADLGVVVTGGAAVAAIAAGIAFGDAPIVFLLATAALGIAAAQKLRHLRQPRATNP